jgi:hypothetical protein
MTKSKAPTLGEAVAPFKRLSDCLESKPGASARARLDAVRAAEAVLEKLAPLLRETRTELEARVTKALDEFESDLRDIAARRGWRLEGGWPTFQIERGVELRVEPIAGLVRVASKAFDATELGAIEAAIAALVPGLLPKKFVAGEFLEQVERAYRSVANRSSQVPIWDLYGRMVLDAQTPRFWRDATAERFVALSPDQFRARLSAMLEAGATTTRGAQELRLLPPLDPKDALFVYNPGEQRFAFVGRIEFVTGERS